MKHKRHHQYTGKWLVIILSPSPAHTGSASSCNKPSKTKTWLKWDVKKSNCTYLTFAPLKQHRSCEKAIITILSLLSLRNIGRKVCTLLRSQNFPKIMKVGCLLSLPSSSFLKKPSLPCLPGWQVVLFAKHLFSPLTSYCPHPTLFHLLALVPWLSLAGLSLQTIITALRLVGVRCCRQVHGPPSPTPKLPAKLWLRSIIPDLEIKFRGLAW